MSAELIKFSITPGWDYIRPIREFIGEFVYVKSGNRERADDVIFIANELIENAVKNANNKKILISCKVYDTVTEITVSNSIQRDKYDMLKEKLFDVCKKRAEQLYGEKFREKTFWEDEKGAIGLIMINERCEGKITIQYKNLSVVITCIIPYEE